MNRLGMLETKFQQTQHELEQQVEVTKKNTSQRLQETVQQPSTAVNQARLKSQRK